MIDIRYYDFYDLRNKLWSGAVDTIKIIEENDKVDELMWLLDDVFQEPTEIVKINDFLWFDSEFIYETLNIEED